MAEIIQDGIESTRHVSPQDLDDADLDNWLLAGSSTAIAEWARRQATASTADVEKRAWDPSLHPRLPSHSPGGGRFTSVGAAIDHALVLHSRGEGHSDPLHGVERRHLLAAARRHGLTVSRGTSDEHVAQALLDRHAAPPTLGRRPARSSDGLDQLKDRHLRDLAPKATAKTVLEGDFAGLTRVGPRAGANPGGVFEASDGSRWYVKAAQSPAHAREEALALDLYRAAGVDTSQMVVGQGLDELGSGTQVASRMLINAKVDLQSHLHDPAYLAEVRKGFATDSWLANWDVAGANPEPGFGWDNIVSVAGKPVRIDAGGALRYRGLGDSKGSLFGPTVNEWTTLRDAERAPRAAYLFRDITPQQLRASVEHVRSVTPVQIRKLVASHGLDKELADLLIARRANLLRAADAEFKPISQAEFNRRLKAAKRGEEALGATPIGRIGGYLGNDKFRGADVFTDRDWIAVRDAIRSYGADNYEDINIVLRGGHEAYSASDLDDINEKIDWLDKAMGKSSLGSDVTLWRGTSGETIFGAQSKWPADFKGFMWRDDAFSSTSADQAQAEFFAQGGPVLMRLVVPKGTSAIQLSDSRYESEMLLNRGMTFRVVKDHGMTDTISGIKGTKLRLLDVEVIPSVVWP